MSAPAVTIGMPVFNGAALMRRAIDSVLSQDFQDLELVISDNASTDGTAAVAGEYAAKHARVRHVRLPQTVHPISNFRNALDEARGSFFSWLAHDDFYETGDHVAQLVSALSNGKTFAFPGAYAAHLLTDGTLRRDDRDMLTRFAGLHTRQEIAHAAVRHASVQVYGMYRTETIRDYVRLLIEDQDMECYFESRMVQALLIHEPWAYVPEARLNIGVSEESHSQRTNARLLLRDFLRYMRRVLALYRDSPRYTRMERFSIYMQVLGIYLPHAARLFGSVLKTFWKRA